MSFDHLAPHYDWMEAVLAGRLLQRARTVWLDELAGCKRILSAGEGHGRFAAACMNRFPEATLVCLESSAAMQARARKRLAAARTGQAKTGSRVEWISASLPGWRPPERSFDAIVTCFFLDCFAPRSLEAVVQRLADAARDEATWIVVDFSLPARGLARWRARAIHAAMYAFFRVVTRLSARRWTAPDPWLRRHGFSLARRCEFEWGLLRADVWRRDAPLAPGLPA